MRELELITAASLADARPGPSSAEPGDGPKHAAAHAECLNCGERLHGRFCARCGQTADDHHRSIFHLAWEAVEGFTHLDGRLAKTLPALFFRPGSLARDHFEGRRQRHVPPFRLFLISLLLFMLVLEVLVHQGGGHGARVAPGAPAEPGAHLAVGAPGLAPPEPPTPPGLTAPRPPLAPRIDPVDTAAMKGSLLGAQETAGIDAAADMGGAVSSLEASGLGKNPIAHWVLERSKAAGVSPEYFTSVTFEWAHRLAVLLLPIFALLLTLCYVYRRRFYVYDHLIVSMQFLSFIFLVAAVSWALPSPVRGPAILAASVWTPVNLFMIMRGAYGSSIVGALVKTAFLWLSTLCLFGMLLLGILVVALSQMK